MLTPPSQTFWSLFGSARIWLKYEGRGLVSLMRAHVTPLSSDRYTPPNVAVPAVDVERAAPHIAGGRKSAGHLGPVRTAVGRPVQPPVRAAPAVAEYRAPPLVGSRVQDI